LDKKWLVSISVSSVGSSAVTLCTNNLPQRFASQNTVLRLEQDIQRKIEIGGIVRIIDGSSMDRHQKKIIHLLQDEKKNIEQEK
jgi:hypothetical protein